MLIAPNLHFASHHRQWETSSANLLASLWNSFSVSLEKNDSDHDAAQSGGIGRTKKMFPLTNLFFCLAAYHDKTWPDAEGGKKWIHFYKGRLLTFRKRPTTFNKSYLYVSDTLATEHGTQTGADMDGKCRKGLKRVETQKTVKQWKTL